MAIVIGVFEETDEEPLDEELEDVGVVIEKRDGVGVGF